MLEGTLSKTLISFSPNMKQTAIQIPLQIIFYHLRFIALVMENREFILNQLTQLFAESE